MSKAKLMALIGACLLSLALAGGTVTAYTPLAGFVVIFRDIAPNWDLSSIFGGLMGSIFGTVIGLAELAFVWLAFAKRDRVKNKGWRIYLLVVGILSVLGGLGSLGLSGMTAVTLHQTRDLLTQDGALTGLGRFSGLMDGMVIAYGTIGLLTLAAGVCLILAFALRDRSVEA